MTREEANEILEDWNLCHYTPSREAAEVVISALDPLEIFSALRPVSREQVEKAEWIWSTGDVYTCSSCGEKTHVDECMENPIYNFCQFCMAPMTDEAVEMVMERINKMEETGNGLG